MKGLLESLLLQKEQELDPTLARLVQEKTGGYEPLRRALIHLAGDVSAQRFILFCQVTPVGTHLKKTFEAWRKAQSVEAQERLAWKLFALQQAKKALQCEPLKFVTPKGCNISTERRAGWVRLRLQRLVAAMSLDELTRAHFGEEPHLTKFKQNLCLGCHDSKCAHHSRYAPEQSGLIQLRVVSQAQIAEPLRVHATL